MLQGVAAQGRLENEHAIPIGEEAVALSYGLALGFEDELTRGEGRDKHDERALRQVKVGE